MKRDTAPKYCWVCARKLQKYAQEHHVVGRGDDMGLTVWLCRGCHYLVRQLSQRKLLAQPHKLADLITLARFEAGLEDARTIIIYDKSGSESAFCVPCRRAVNNLEKHLKTEDHRRNLRRYEKANESTTMGVGKKEA